MSEELKLCSLDGCGKRAKNGDRFCSMHRARLTRTGRFDKKSISERIQQNSNQSADTGCWMWTGAKNGEGYGRLKIGQRNVLAHRAAYSAFVGEIPDGMLVMHSCDTPSCVNPSHLSIGTNKDNMADMRAKGRQQDWCLGKFGSEHPSSKGYKRG